MSSSVSPWTIAEMTKARSAHYSFFAISKYFGEMGEGKLWKQLNTWMSWATTGHLADFTRRTIHTKWPNMRHSHSLFTFCLEFTLLIIWACISSFTHPSEGARDWAWGLAQADHGLSELCPSVISFIILIQSVCFLNFCGSYRERAQLLIWWWQCGG